VTVEEAYEKGLQDGLKNQCQLHDKIIKEQKKAIEKWSKQGIYWNDHYLEAIIILKWVFEEGSIGPRDILRNKVEKSLEELHEL